jgi:hypothetical protein
MTVRRGINILDLLPRTTGIASAIPDGIIEQIGILNVLDHRSTTSPAYFLHEGRLQAVAEQFDLDTADWMLSVPGVSTGLPFRLAITRQAPTQVLNAFNQEDAPAAWTLDIDVNPVKLLLPFLHAATTSEPNAMATPTLTAVQGTDADRRVVLQASCVLRISGGGGNPARVQLVDAPDPLDPAAPSGATVRASMVPNTAVVGQSQYGVKAEALVVDLSRQFTPAEIMDRGHDEAWTGFSLKEMTFFLPIHTPLVDNMTLGVRDLIVGKPFGMQGEVAADLSKAYPVAMNGFVVLQQGDGKGGVETLAVQQPDTSVPEFVCPVQPNDQGGTRRVRAVFNLSAALPGVADTKVVGVWWEVPGGTEGNSETTTWFDAPTDAMLRYRLRIADATLAGQPAVQHSLPSSVPDKQTELQQITVRFPRDAGAPSGAMPIVDAACGGASYPNTIHVRGPRALVDGVVLNTRGGTVVRWQAGAGSAPAALTGVSFALALLPPGKGPFDVMVTDDDGDKDDTKGVRRIRVDLVASGPLVIGHQDAQAPDTGRVSVSNGGVPTLLQPARVNDTFLSRPYHAGGTRSTAPQSAALSGNAVKTAPGTSAEVEVAVPDKAGAEPPPVVAAPTYTPSAAQMLFAFGESIPVRLVAESETQKAQGADAQHHEALAWPMAIDLDKRSGPQGGDIHAQLEAWVAELKAKGPTAERRFYVVGRTDDLWYGATAAANKDENRKLATARMNAAVAALVRVVGQDKIRSRIENDPVPSGWPTEAQGAPKRMRHTERLALPSGNDTSGTPYMDSGTGGKPVWRHGWEPDVIGDAAGASHAQAAADRNRTGYRCAEIFAIDENQPPPVPAPNLAGTASRIPMLVPGTDGPLLPAVAPVQGASTDFRVRAKVRWDSPITSGPADFIPTLAEASVRWKPSDSKLPAIGGNPPPVVASTEKTGPDYWEVLLNWAFDTATGQTEATGSLALPKGKLQLISDVWASGFAFAPALAARVDKTDVTGSEVGDFIGGLACITAGLAIGLFINKDAGPDDHRGSVIIDKFTLGYKWNGAPHVAATLDYTVDLRIKTGIQGVFSISGNLKLAYKGVGLRFDGGLQGGLKDVSFSLQDLSVQVADPGTWSLGGPLGDLIRVAATRMGNGSQWIEFDLEFALDLGVIRLEGAVLRMRFDADPVQAGLELRGLTAVVDVPQTLSGRGSATVGDGGAFSAMLGLDVIPAKLSAMGAIAVKKDFVAVEVAIQLPVGIPLGGTGLGLFGFMGRFVANGRRNLDKCSKDDPVQRQLDWYGLEPIDKFTRQPGQYAFGVGAVIGTLPDGGFSFNAEGALSLGFPDLSLVFSIDAHLVKARKSQATSTGKSDGTLRILGMAVIDADAVTIALRTTYAIPKLLELRIPISAYFPADASHPWYIRIGSDNGPGRGGDPVTITLFPGILDLKAWAFVMFEERELLALGGSHIPKWAAVPSLDFHGFAIGVGAGFDVKWSSGPFSLSASAFLVVGLGTKPMLCAGAAGVAGSLDLVIASLDVSGWLYFIVGDQQPAYMEGHFKAEIDCWLFTVEGHVDITIGSKLTGKVEAPPSPVMGLDLCDHFAVVKGRAVPGDSAVPVVWPDTVGVLKFAHYLIDKEAADSEDGKGVHFKRQLVPAAPLTPWNGSTQLKYAYRLTGLELSRFDGANWVPVEGNFDAVWWLPTHRKAVIENAQDGIPPSAEEGRELGLFTLDPAPWARWLTPASGNVPGNPVSTLGTLCDPPAPLLPSCALGQDRSWMIGTLGTFKALPSSASVYPSGFLATARPNLQATLAELVALCATAGYEYLPAQVAPLATPFLHDGAAIAQGWRFPSFRKQQAMAGTVPLAFTLSRALAQGTLYLQACTERGALVPPALRICDSMPRQDGGVDSFTGESGAVYRGRLECLATGRERIVRLRTAMAATHAEAVDEVAVWLDPGPGADAGAALLTAFDSDGKVVDQMRTQGPGRQWLTVKGTGIVRIQLEPKGRAPIDVYTACWGAAADDTAAGRICDTMPAESGRGFSGTSGAQYEGVYRAVAVDGGRAIQLGKLAGMRREAVTEVSVELQPGDGVVTLIAYDPSGQVVGRAVSNGPQRQWLTVAGTGIVRIVVDPGRGSGVLVFAVCWGAQWPAHTPGFHALLGIDRLATPRVVAVDEAGGRLVLEGKGGQSGATFKLCDVLAYALPERPAGKRWIRIEAGAWFRGNLALVALCGVTADAAEARQQDQAFKQSLIGLLTDKAKKAGNAENTNKPDIAEGESATQPIWLEAATQYKLAVSWQWTSWQPATPGEEAPASLDKSTWSLVVRDELRFDTAAYGLATATPSPDPQVTLDSDPAQGGPGFDERSFDPRGLARYVTRAYPGHEDPPHFLDDPLGFWFNVNHLPSLVGKYDGRELHARVYHTRPPAGSVDPADLHVNGAPHKLDKTLGVPKWETTLDAWTWIDARIAQTVADLPCLDVAPGSGASKVAVKGDLEPGSEYDLLLKTVKPGDAKVDEVVVARTHFRTSRYRDPAGLLAALGFAPSTGADTPNDVITTFDLAAQYGTAQLAVGDAALDAALKACGMDPWPLPPAPRTTLIWRQTGDAVHPWQVVGVLLEADEPLWRAGMRTGALNEPAVPPRVEVASLEVYRTHGKLLVQPGGPVVKTVRERVADGLREVVRNSAGTRLLFAAGAAPVALDKGASLFDLELRLKEKGEAGAVGVVSMFGRPSIVALEL